MIGFRLAAQKPPEAKRVKDDVREVQQSYECGMKISGYDDIKVDDVIEAYRIQKVQRTLS